MTTPSDYAGGFYVIRGATMHYLVVGFLVMLGAMAAVASAPVIFVIAVGAMKVLLIVLIVGVVAGVVWFIRVL
jgi:hypothetical protein